jgi:hypothetical protein
MFSKKDTLLWKTSFLELVESMMCVCVCVCVEELLGEEGRPVWMTPNMMLQGGDWVLWLRLGLLFEKLFPVQFVGLSLLIPVGLV